jgi:hypothetical protein
VNDVRRFQVELHGAVQGEVELRRMLSVGIGE